MKKSKETVNIALFIIFVLFAVVQLNDPDGIIWFLIYALVATICLYNNYKSIPNILLWIAFIGLVAYSVFYLSLFIDYLQTDNKEEIFGEMIYEKPYLEGTREFLGLWIAALAIIYQIKGRKK